MKKPLIDFKTARIVGIVSIVLMLILSGADGAAGAEQGIPCRIHRGRADGVCRDSFAL